MIFVRSPLSMSSPAWFGITVVLPSGCWKNMWLPSCLLSSKPSFLRILFTSFALRSGILVMR